MAADTEPVAMLRDAALRAAPLRMETFARVI
jgi:hypothetical protein